MTLLDSPDFRESHVYRELERQPLGFIDVGARGGVPAFIDAVAAYTAVLAFEPDSTSLDALRAMLSARLARACVEELAIGGAAGRAPLHLYAHSVNHSLLPVDPAFRDRYGVSSLADRGQTQVTVETLDHVVFDRRADDPNWGEIIKLDAQGAELDILRGGARTLKERAVALVVEVCFLDIYQGQPRFSHIERHLAALGFTFYGFLSLQGWSRKFIDKASGLGRERLCFGDAVFLRDPLPGADGRGVALSPRRWAMLYLSALLLGYYDFAIELACEAALPKAEADRLVRLGHQQSEQAAGTPIAEVEALLARMRAAPQRAAVELGRFIDGRRTLFDMADADLPRTAPLPRIAPQTGMER